MTTPQQEGPSHSIGRRHREITSHLNRINSRTIVDQTITLTRVHLIKPPEFQIWEEVDQEGMVRQQLQCKIHWWPWWVWVGVFPCHPIRWWYLTLKIFNKWTKGNLRASWCLYCRWLDLKLHHKWHLSMLAEVEDKIKVSILSSNKTSKEVMLVVTNRINKEEIRVTISRGNSWI